MFLPESEQTAGDYDQEDNSRVHDIPEKYRKNRGADQDENDRTRELPEQQARSGPTLFWAESVRPELRQTLARLIVR